jgi:nitrite reductase/ring-hydroxylating ferredoxin subunit
MTEDRGPRQWPVARASEIGPGEYRFVEVKSHSISVFNIHGEYIAVLNICPHELAPVCKGKVRGTTLPSPPGEFKWGREGEILACPWHGWEFDLLTGKALTDERVRLRRYPVSIVDDVILLTL